MSMIDQPNIAASTQKQIATVSIDIGHPGVEA
jgi:hypothetical protein